MPLFAQDEKFSDRGVKA